MADIAAQLLREHIDHDIQTLKSLEGQIANARIKVREDEGRVTALRARIAELESALDTLETGIAYG